MPAAELKWFRLWCDGDCGAYLDFPTLLTQEVVDARGNRHLIPENRLKPRDRNKGGQRWRFVGRGIETAYYCPNCKTRGSDEQRRKKETVG